MLQFDPLRILEWMWPMMWGRSLVIVTISAVGLAVALQIIGWEYRWAWVTAILMLVALLFIYLQYRTNLRRKIDDLITGGEQIEYGVKEVPFGSLKQYDTESENKWKWHGDRVDRWYQSVSQVLKGTRYEKQWASNAGLDKPEDEFSALGFDWYLKVWRNAMKLRLRRLEDIRNSL